MWRTQPSSVFKGIILFLLCCNCNNDSSSEGTEYPRAYIVPSRSGISSKSIQNYVAKHVARHKHLTGGVVFVDVIPKNGSGKILRRQLRERAKKETASVAYKAKM